MADHLPHRNEPETAQLAANADRLFGLFNERPGYQTWIEANRALEDYASELRYDEVETAFAIAERLRELEYVAPDEAIGPGRPR